MNDRIRCKKSIVVNEKPSESALISNEVADAVLHDAVGRDNAATDSALPQGSLPYSSVVPWFEMQSAKSPDATAVVFSDDRAQNHASLSYGELDQRANHLAHRLIDIGIKADDLVGVCIDRSLNMIVAILGVLKAGGAYVPLDPNYPRQRQQQMIVNSRLAAVLTDHSAADSVPEIDGKIINIDHWCNEHPYRASSSPDLALSPDRLACVIYTSGSTGKPKGVMIEHRNIVNTVLRARAQFNPGPGPGSRVALFASISFVMSIGDIFSTLCSGATLIVGSRSAMMPGEALTAFLQANRVDTICMAASSLALLSAERHSELSNVLVAGEPCSADVMRRWAKGRNFILGYGMTEATGGVMHKKCTGSEVRPTLGKPNPNMSIHILDQNMQPVGRGGHGELYIGGAGLGRGYLNDPKLTADRFLKDPFSDDPGARLYRSGDLARCLDSGDIEFSGRADFQITVRGFRIEPYEIESVLNRHQQVQRAVVAARMDPAHNKRLVAYYQKAPDFDTDIGKLRSDLSKELPEHMIPSTFVRMERLPLTPSGKLDRLSLPDMTQENLTAQLTNTGDGAVSKIESLVTDIFCQVLGVRTLGVRENFFEIGADSLILAKTCDQLRSKLGIDIPVIRMFEFPSIQRLCRFIEAGSDPATAKSTLIDPGISNGDKGKKPDNDQLIVLSARDPDQLRMQARRLIEHLEQHWAGRDKLRDIAYTLQVGRKALHHRLAVIAAEVDALARKLQAFASTGHPSDGLFLADSSNPDRTAKELLQIWQQGSERTRVFAERDLARLARIWIAGGEVDWQALYTDEQPYRVPLPTYPFALHQYSLPPVVGAANLKQRDGQQRTGQTDPDQLFFASTWRQASIQSTGHVDTGAVLLFDHDEALCHAFRKCRPEVSVTVVSPGAAFKQLNDERFEINPCRADDYHALYQSLELAGGMPSRIVHYWSRKPLEDDWTRTLDTQLELGFLALFHLGKMLISRQSKSAIRLIYAHTQNDCPLPAFTAVSAFANSLMLEERSIQCQSVEFDSALSMQPVPVANTLLQELDCTDQALRIRHSTQSRFVRRLEEFRPTRHSTDRLPLKRRGVYLITGGLGGLGFIFAEFLAERYQARLVLTGRSTLSIGQKAEIERLESFGAEVLCLTCDITDSSAVRALIQTVKARFAEINGVIHSAGVIRRHFIRDTQAGDIEAVLPPKLSGTIHLDHCLADEALDFFTLFSSISAEIESLGLPAYAFANAFLDQFARYRESLRAQGSRHGKSLSINWPLWRHGGMQPGQQTESILAQTLGMHMLRTETGIDAFVQGLGFEHSHFMLIEGNAEKIRKAVVGPKVQPSTQSSRAELEGAWMDRLGTIAAEFLKRSRSSIDPNETFDAFGFDSLGLTEFCVRLNTDCQLCAPLTPADLFEHSTISALAAHLAKVSTTDIEPLPGGQQPGGQPPQVADRKLPAHESALDLKQVTIEVLTLAAASLLKRDRHELNPDETLQDYGFDSLGLTEFAVDLNKRFDLSPPLSPAVLFEHSSIKALAVFLVEVHQRELIQALGSNEDTQTGVPETAMQTKAPVVTQSPRPQTTCSSLQTPAAASTSAEPVAIIGMSGMLPQSDSLEQFWQHLVNGDDMITQVPASRWDWKSCYGDPETEDNKTNIIWGGFLNRIEAFDPLFFSISPREAEMMDPQQRLFLEVSWKTIENSGYRPSDFSGSQTGVFVGITNSGYRELIARHEPSIDAFAATGTALSMVPNRVSHLLNLHGPSEPVDTACSSSLVAVHRAVRAIQSGECEMAIAGGVNVILSPLNYIYLAKAGILSPNGRCSTFDAQADGFVRSEGVGALLLKPLHQARADGDRVHAIIRATAVNHGGHANSLTAPNTSAQAALLVDAYSKAGIDPATVNYIETHGTGTRLGDPVEINALKKAFSELHEKWGKGRHRTHHCGIGSVKTNIGHLEAAAGMAGIFKTVMALDREVLPGNLHFDTLNPFIDLRDSPFYVVDKTRAWTTETDSSGNPLPRRAGVSSFGFGGANAHVVLEQSRPDASDTAMPTRAPSAVSKDTAERVFVLSARNRDRLQVYARNLASHLCEETAQPTEINGWRTALVKDLRNMAADMLGLEADAVCPDTPLHECGLDHRIAGEFADLVATRLGVEDAFRSLQTQPSLNALADELARRYAPLLVAHYSSANAKSGSFGPSPTRLPRSVDIAYTLQIGREPMSERLAIVCRLAELPVKLRRFADGDQGSDGVIAGRVAASPPVASLLTEEPSGSRFLEAMIDAGALNRLASLWVLGIDIDWKRLYDKQNPQRIPLPTYPFERRSCWIETGHAESATAAHFSDKSHAAHPGNLSPPGASMSIAEGEASSVTLDANSSAGAGVSPQDYVTGVIAGILKIDTDSIDPDAHMEAYGVDSLIISRMTAAFKPDFPELSPTIFYTCKTFGEVCEQLAERYPEAFAALGVQPSSLQESLTPLMQTGSIRPSNLASDSATSGNLAEHTNSDTDTDTDEDIAIIGVSGRFPGAPDVATFWENLKSGKDSVTAIPGERWNPEDYPGVYCRQGGFLDDIDRFDARFFNITADRARFMSAQERLFLQTAWSCIEDAGYTRERLADPQAGDRRGDVGVFAGVSYNEYQLNAMEEWAAGNVVPVNTQICSVANRVSYFLNLRGPSLSVDTACSSSLYALHLACRSIRSGECSMAIAGGVNLSQHPAKYVTLCSISMLSRKGRCNAFGEGGDGMAPAEAVGAVLLKPLKQARHDGDPIHAVIKGTAVNHDGKTYGYTVPNPVAQTEVIREALARSGIDASSISYVEAHGTGTSLGDPIEIEGLTNAYRNRREEQGSCAIGSAKSNIGHAEAAAGIVQVIKVLLQMRHHTLVPSILHGSDRLNPNIDFERSRFHLQRSLEPWQQPISDREDKRPLPRRAGITSLGASGVNVHVIMEEYEDALEGRRPGEAVIPAGPLIVPISAKQTDRLVACVEALARHLTRISDNLPRLSDIAHTLQIGREAMDHRVAFLACSTSELIGLLKDFVAAGSAASAIGMSKDIDPQGMDEIARSWVNGESVDWCVANRAAVAPRCISLPGYPFKGQRFWITDSTAPGADLRRTDRPLGTASDTSASDAAACQAQQADNAAGTPADNAVGIPAMLLELAEAPQSEQVEIIARQLQDMVAKLLGYETEDRPPVDEGFFAMGVESMQVVSLQAQIGEVFQYELEDTAVFDYPDIASLADHLVASIPFDDILVERGALQADGSLSVAGETVDGESMPFTASLEGNTTTAQNADTLSNSDPTLVSSVEGSAPDADTGHSPIADDLDLLDKGPLSEDIRNMSGRQVRAALVQELLEVPA